jgi:hypothetical protein
VFESLTSILSSVVAKWLQRHVETECTLRSVIVLRRMLLTHSLGDMFPVTCQACHGTSLCELRSQLLIFPFMIATNLPRKNLHCHTCPEV